MASLSPHARRLLLIQHSAMKRSASRDLHERLAELPMLDRSMALMEALLDKPDRSAVRQLARACAALEHLASRLNEEDRQIVAGIFSATGRELMNASARH